MSIVRSLNATALHARTADLCTTNIWVEENGFTVPAAYSSTREEQWVLSERAALSDLSARQVWAFRGADAASFLSFATLDDAAAMAPARAPETYWCDDSGFVRGKGTLVRRAAGEFELMTPIRDLAWMLDGAEGFDVELRDVTNERATLGIAGPLAQTLLSEAALLSRELHAGDVIEGEWRASRVTLLRLAGDAGFELLTPAEDAILAWDKLWRAGRQMGLGVVGAQTLELARIEAGRLKPGLDWLPAQETVTDEDLRLPTDFGVNANLTRRFNGVDALRRAETNARPVAIQIRANEAIVLGALSLDGADVGRLMSAAWSEARDEAVAIGWVDPTAVKLGTALTAPGAAGPVEARVAMIAPGRNA